MSQSERKLIDAPGLRLLALFDALVRRDTHQPGLEGTLAMGVDALWWLADFRENAKTTFHASRPAADVHVFFSIHEAEDLLISGKLGQGVRLEGNRDVFSKFIARYTQKQTWLDIRAT